MGNLHNEDIILSDQILLEISNIFFQYSKNAQILRGASLTVKSGHIIGISGENGSGKTTFLKVLIGLLKPTKGEVRVHGKIGYSPQNILLFENLTVSENFQVFGRGLDMEKSQIISDSRQIMKRLNFLKYENSLVKNLSGGTAQKLNFGISLLGDPNILILDEPYQGLDYASFQAFWDIQFELRKLGKSIIIVSHLIEDLSRFSESYTLNKGLLIKSGDQ